jgi:3-hydroxybutyryl-CoA dehydrogenase
MDTQPIESIAVVGAGTMGHGIAQVAAMAGHRVRLFDADPRQAVAALEKVRANLDKGIERGKLSAAQRDEALTRLETATDLRDAVEGVQLVIEAAPERMDLKVRIFAELEAATTEDTLLATNTSSLSVSEIARATRRPERVIGLHFFNPVHLMKLLEVVRGSETSDATLHAALDFAERIGKQAIVVTDTPGFASSRLGVVLGLEAIRMVEQGVASPQDIDRAMELGYNHPMGPLRLTDVVGLDVRLGIADYLHGTLGGAQYAAPALLRTMVGDGRLGRKSGQGFYRWEDA